MTTPRDAIAGLSERLREESERLSYNSLTHGCATCGVATNLADEAATQLDSLLKERDALQARVKELESGIAHAQYRSDNCDAENQSLYNRLEAVESRATRIQQERDEAYERAAESQRALWFVLDANDGFTLEPADMESYPGDDRAEIVTTRNNCDGSISLKAAIRRLAGPEKEKKECNLGKDGGGDTSAGRLTAFANDGEDSPPDGTEG